MLPRTLSGRTILTFSAIFATVLVGVGIVLTERLRTFHTREVQRVLDTAGELLSPSALGILSGDASQREEFARAAERLKQRHLRVTLIHHDGRVEFDNEVPLPLQNHSGRPELLEAEELGVGSSERPSTSTGVATLYVARRLRRDGTSVGYIRVAAELRDVASEISRLRSLLWICAALAFVLAAVGALIVARWLARPLEEIEEVATALADGELETQARIQGPVEVERLGLAIHRMAEQLRARIAGLKSARSEIEAILGSMTEGVVAVDPAERVLHMNAAAARMLGLKRPLEPGAELWRHVRFPDLETALRGVLQGGEGRHGDAPSPGFEGRVLSVSVAPVNREIGAVAVLADVTEMRRLEQMRIDFVANVSHEIRTPLAAVMGAVETLSDPDQTPDVRARFVQIADRNAQRLMAIVSDLLELSRIETEGQRMEVMPLSVVSVVRTVVSALSSAAERKGVDIEMEQAPAESFRILGNGQRLEQVFTNLIENAVKYTGKGGKVAIRFRDRGDEVDVEIQDTGVGIPAEALPRVFERFYRVDKSRSREMGGTGLGLAIVKHAVRAHGGKVSVRSEEGRGSAFIVTLPKRLPDPSAERDAV